VSDVDVRIPDHQPVQFLLEMRHDGFITIATKPGCSVADVHDMLREVTLYGGRFEHLVIDDHEHP